MVPPVLPSYISFLGLLGLVVAQSGVFNFSYPPPIERGFINSGNTSMAVGTTQKIRWQTSWSSYEIALYQYHRSTADTRLYNLFSTVSNINNLSSPTNAVFSLGKAPAVPELSNFIWTVQLYQAKLSDSSSFYLRATQLQGNGVAYADLFNINNIATTTTTPTTFSTTRSSSTTSSTTRSSSTSSTATTAAAITTTPPVPPPPPSNSNTPIALGVSIPIGLLLIALIGFLIFRRRQKQRRNASQSLGLPQTDPYQGQDYGIPLPGPVGGDRKVPVHEHIAANGPGMSELPSKGRSFPFNR